MRTHEKKCSVYGFYGFGEAYNRANREALWQELRIHDVGGKLLSGIKSMLIV